MRTKTPRFHRLLTLTGLLTLSATLATAQPYTYETFDPPFGGGRIEITAITTLGKLAGTFEGSSDLGPFGSWVWFNATEGFRRVSSRDKRLSITDMNGSTRLVGTYFMPNTAGSRDQGFTIRSGTFTALKLPPLVRVLTCAINEAHDIVCTGLTAQEVIQAVRVKSTTPGVLQVYPPGVYLTGISAARDVVGVQFDPQLDKFRGYYRQASTGDTALFDAPCGLDTVFMGINPAGTLATAQCGHWNGHAVTDAEDSERAVIDSDLFDGEHWTAIQVPEAFTTHVTRVNNAGQVVGTYREVPEEGEVSTGTWHGFVATPAPIGDVFSAQ